MDLLQQRIDLLHRSGQIDMKTRDSLQNVLRLLNEQFGMDLNEETGSMMITHLAMAVSRQLEGKSIKEMDEDQYSELRNDEDFEKASHIWKAVQEVLPVPFTTAEKQYMLLHLAALLKQI